MTATPAKKNTGTKLLAGLVGLGVVIGVASCGPEDDTTASSTPSTTGEYTAAPLPASPVAADPYKTNGTYLVGSEIAAGDYRAIARGGLGYVEVCADAACEIGTPGFISNDLVDGSSVVSIPADAKFVKLQDVELVAL